MFKRSDSYSFSNVTGLYEKTTILGSITERYQVTKYDDVWLTGAAAATEAISTSYLIEAVQTIKVANANAVQLSPINDLNSYSNYPVLINTICQLQSTDGSPLSATLQDYFPQTLNTALQTSGVVGQTEGKTSGTTSSNTVGSSTSQTNSFGVSISTESASAHYDHSSTTTSEHSATTGSEASTSRGSEASNSVGMSLKDWGAYAFINPQTNDPSWTFGQEYPWDVIQCRRTDNATNPDYPTQVRIVLPDSMSTRLFDETALQPPSQLSMFGVSFTTKSKWLIKILKNQVPVANVAHVVNYFTGSHRYDDGGKTSVSAYLDPQPAILTDESGQSVSTALNLPLMALDPIGAFSSGAIIGFNSREFLCDPTPSSTTTPAKAFIAVSSSNNLYLQDSSSYPSPTPTDQGGGFSSSTTGLSASFSKAISQLHLQVYVKIVDVSKDYTLYMKHWKIGEGGVSLSFTVNGNDDTATTKYVTDAESEGGERNLTTISLRNLDYMSGDYHDDLKLGLNVIDIVIKPISLDLPSQTPYIIRALSVE